MQISSVKFLVSPHSSFLFGFKVTETIFLFPPAVVWMKCDLLKTFAASAILSAC